MEAVKDICVENEALAAQIDSAFRALEDRRQAVSAALKTEESPPPSCLALTSIQAEIADSPWIALTAGESFAGVSAAFANAPSRNWRSSSRFLQRSWTAIRR